MTVVAWDGRILAADRRASNGTLISVTTKIWRVGEALVAVTGDFDMASEKLAWFRSGADPEKFPAAQRDKDAWSSLLVVLKDYALHKYEKTPHPIVLEDRIYAMGSGRDFALMAMHLGKSAPEAVELAGLFDSGCGNGVDWLEHER